MAGHRRGLGKPSRPQARHDRMTRRMAEARTPQESASAAFDWLRLAASFCDDQALASARLREVASHMSAVARELEKGRSR